MVQRDYQCLRVRRPIQIDGDLSKAVWQQAACSPRFGDMVTGEPEFWTTVQFSTAEVEA